MVQVKVGHSVKALRPFAVNNDALPCYINTAEFEGYIMVRMQNYKHTTDENTAPVNFKTTSPYFDEKRRKISITFSGRFKRQWKGDEIVFVNDFDSKLKLPSCFGLFVKLAKLIDPGFIADHARDEKPWLGSWLLGLNTMRVEKYNPRRDSLLDDDDVDFETKKSKPSISFGWKYSSGVAPTESNHIGVPDASRKKHFSKPENRSSYTFTTDNLYTFDYFDHRIDFNTLDVDMGMCKINARRHLNDQPLRFVLRSKDKSTTFFVVELSDWE
ncbi:hypothetical protein BKA69DRAFT_1173365 [Paraphysoderma sedebokerense]|nr:hypothetical protein BKA69DRAFT_1173365 [Paraphysoderma sedebokerense]